MVYMIESQVAYVDDALQTMDAEGLELLETTPEAQEAYRELIAEKSTRHGLAGRRLRQLVPRQARPQHHAVAGFHLPVPQADRSASTGRTTSARPPARRRTAEVAA